MKEPLVILGGGAVGAAIALICLMFWERFQHAGSGYSIAEFGMSIFRFYVVAALGFVCGVLVAVRLVSRI